MKIRKPITLWERIENAIIDLSDLDEPLEPMTDLQMVERLIELAHHYRLEYKMKCDELEELTWQ